MPLLVPLLVVSAALAQQSWPKPDERIVCGPLTLDVHVSRTAHVFHLVDQISAWDNSCHAQYRAAMKLSDDDEAALREYAAVRVKRRWGQGLEQAFYVPLDLDAAIKAGIRDKHLTDDEARAIRPVLDRFSGRADELLAAKRAAVDRAFSAIDRARLTKAATQLARFTGVKKLVVPAFPIASPSAGGGAMDGGRLRWEIDGDAVNFSVLVHELSHAFFMQEQDQLDALVARTPGLTATLLGEGLAYAMAPGIYGNSDADNLQYNVAKDRAADAAWKDDGPGRYRLYALALRPLYADALETSTLEAFLPRARDVFLAMREIEESSVDAGGPPRLGIAGPAANVVRERLLEGKFQNWITCVDHSEASYGELLPKLGSKDLLVLLISGDDATRIPAKHAGLSPLSLEEIERRLKKGETIAETKQSGRMRVVLLAAPTRAALEHLARTSPALAE